MGKRIIWLIVVTIIWVFMAAVLANTFLWPRDATSPGGISFWMWIVLGLFWWAVIGLTSVKKAEPGSAKESGDGWPNHKVDQSGLWA